MKRLAAAQTLTHATVTPGFLHDSGGCNQNHGRQPGLRGELGARRLRQGARNTAQALGNVLRHFFKPLTRYVTKHSPF